MNDSYMGSGDGTLLTVIECDGCKETIGTVRQMKFIQGKGIKYVYCNDCGDKIKEDIQLMEKQLKELQTLLRLAEKELQNVDKFDGM